MAVESQPDRLPTWTGPEACPFCGTPLADGGPAFMAHVGDPRLRGGLRRWRARVADDIVAGWSGRRRRGSSP